MIFTKVSSLKYLPCFIISLLQISCDVEKEFDDNVLTIATYDDVNDWDPGSAFSLEVLPMSNIYEPLLWFDASVNPPIMIPALATSYLVSESGLKWTFNLREHVSFHDGMKFNASAVKYVVDRNKTLKKGPSYIWNYIERVEEDQEYQVSFYLKSPVALDKIVSSQYGAWIYSPNISKVGKDSMMNGYASGTGPYKLARWEKNSHIVLQRNENYWGGWKKKGHFDSVVIRVVTEASTRLQMLRKGLADYAILIPTHLISTVRDRADILVKYFPSWLNHFYLINTKKPPTDNIWVRRAIASCFNRDILTKYIYPNSANKASGAVPGNLTLILPPDTLIEFSLKRAERYIERSGIKKEDIKIDLSYVSTSEEYRLTSLMLLDNLRKIGIGLDLKPGLWSSNWDKARNFKTSPNIISMAWWPTLSSPSDWFYGLYKTQKEPLFNLSYYSNSRVDSLIDLAWTQESLSTDSSIANYKKIQDILIDDCVLIPAVDLNIQAVYSKDIVGLKGNPAYSTLFIYNLVRAP